MCDFDPILNALRPETLPDIEGLELARGERRVVYKDAHDAFQSSGCTWLSLLDSAGPGLPAAVTAAQARACLRSLCHEGLAPSEVLSRANRALLELTSPASFVTCVLLHWDPDSAALTWSSAGFESLLVYRAADDRVEVIRAGAMILGAVAQSPHTPAYRDHALHLEAEDVVLLASDGLGELSRPSGEILGWEAVSATFGERAREASAEELVANLLEWVDEERGPIALEDDLSLLVLKRSSA